MPYSNSTNIPLTYAVWLAAEDDYDLTNNDKVLSATQLLKPIRAIVLGRRYNLSIGGDIAQLIESQAGTAIHSAVEKAWKNYKQAMRDLDIPQSVIEETAINPQKGEEKKHNIYIEKRVFKDFNGFTIGGKFDFCIEGALRDLKNVQTYSWNKDTNEKAYILQASIYRWLNQDIVTEDYFYIDYRFTDWKPYMVNGKKPYPPAKILAKQYSLMSIGETENFIRNQTDQIKELANVDQENLPLCTPEELWMSPKGKARRCGYCNVRSVCSQAHKMEINNELELK
jgi:hypothetical protein